MWHYHSSETLLVGLSLLAISWKYLGSWWRVVPWLFREYTVKSTLLRNNTYIWHLWRLIEKRDMWVDILILSKSYVTEMDPSITQNRLTIHLSASAKGMLASLDYIQGWILYMDRSLKDDLRQEFFFFFFTRSGCPCGISLHRGEDGFLISFSSYSATKVRNIQSTSHCFRVARKLKDIVGNHEILKWG